jgi:hypothetical protein
MGQVWSGWTYLEYLNRDSSKSRYHVKERATKPRLCDFDTARLLQCKVQLLREDGRRARGGSTSIQQSPMLRFLVATIPPTITRPRASPVARRLVSHQAPREEILFHVLLRCRPTMPDNSIFLVVPVVQISHHGQPRRGCHWGLISLSNCPRHPPFKSAPTIVFPFWNLRCSVNRDIPSPFKQFFVPRCPRPGQQC